MANITRIKASDSKADKAEKSDAEEVTRKVRVKAKNSDNNIITKNGEAY